MNTLASIRRRTTYRPSHTVPWCSCITVSIVDALVEHVIHTSTERATSSRSGWRFPDRKIPRIPQCWNYALICAWSIEEAKLLYSTY